MSTGGFLAKKVGEPIICPHDDGDYELHVSDLVGLVTGYCIVRQEGQGEIHDLILNKEEADKLAHLLLNWQPRG